MGLDALFSTFSLNRHQNAIIWKNHTYFYSWLLERIDFWTQNLQKVRPGSVAALEGDFSPNTIALFLALAKRGCVIVPVLRTLSAAVKQEYYRVAAPDLLLTVDSQDNVEVKHFPAATPHPLYANVGAGSAGLVLFSSGTSGKPKAVLHDLAHLLGRPIKRSPAKMLHFLLFDHMGGIDTLLKTLSNAWTVVTVQDRTPDAVCEAIAAHRVEVLSASPTFLNLMLLSRAYGDHDLTSLQLIAYGAEPMPESTLLALRTHLPNVKLRQTYGMSEFGSLKVHSKSSDSLWIKIVDQGVSYRVVDGILQTKTSSSMLGYLNAPSPFTADGWFITGDAVEVDGEYLHILGRKSEMINIGGEKVFPVEVESVVQELENVASAAVYAEKSPIMGNILCVKVQPVGPEDLQGFAKRLKLHCRGRLQAYKVPIKVLFEDREQYSDRFKKRRAA